MNNQPPEEIHINGVKLVLTCHAFPEQYDAFNGRGQEVGYLRLRGGNFTARWPNVMGGIVYQHRFEDPVKGQFDDHDERLIHLTEAVNALKERYR